jgi:hypothetical protein
MAGSVRGTGKDGAESPGSVGVANAGVGAAGTPGSATVARGMGSVGSESPGSAGSANAGIGIGGNAQDIRMP